MAYKILTFAWQITLFFGTILTLAHLIAIWTDAAVVLCRQDSQEHAFSCGWAMFWGFRF